MVTKCKLGTLKSCESKTQYLLDVPCDFSGRTFTLFSLL